MTRLRAGSATDIGLVRAINQDNLLVASPLFAVADGMGGHAAGEVASQTAVAALRQALERAPEAPDQVAEAVRAANRAVWEEAQANPDFRGMGTTITALALIEGVGLLAIANVGDSRTYRLRDGSFEQMTQDHSLVAELVAEGQIEAEEAETHPQRHVLTRALGVYPDVDVDLLTAEPTPGDRYLLCSDGLSRELTDGGIASVLRRLADPTDAARELVAEAKLHGGNDNITVVIVDVLGDGAEPEGEIPPPEPEDATVAEPLAVAAVEEEAQQEERPAPVVETGPPSLSRRERRELRRRERSSSTRPRNRVLTWRVVLFLILLLVVIGGGVAGTAWYARDAYFVGLRNGHITIFQGRPGGLLFWKPTVKQATPYTASSVLKYHLAALRSGVQEATLADARLYVVNLHKEAVQAGVGTSFAGVSP